MSLKMSNQLGFGLPMALFVVTVLAVIISAMASLQSDRASSGSLQVQAHRAYYSAVSGIEASLNLLIPPDGSGGRACSSSPFYSQSFTAAGLMGCSVSVSCTSLTVSSVEYFTLTSVGQCGSDRDSSRRSIEVKIK